MIAEAEETFANTLDRISNAVEDSAEVVAASIRFLMERIIDEPDWGRFLLHTRLSVAHLEMGFGVRLVRDVRVGMEAGRFQIEDLEATLFAGGGDGVCPDGRMPGRRDRRRSSERTATLALNLLGIPNPEASEIAHRPLPPARVLLGPAGLFSAELRLALLREGHHRFSEVVGGHGPLLEL